MENKGINMKNIFKSLLIIIIVIFTISCEKDIDDYRVKFKNYLEQENYILAEKVADTMIEKYPDSASSHFFKGFALFRLKNFSEAEKFIKKSLQLYKNKSKKESQYSFEEVHITLSAVLLDQSKYVESINHVEKVLSIDSTFVLAYNMLAINYYELQNYSKTIKYCNIALQYKDNYSYNEDLVQIYKYKAVAFNKLKKYKEAITVLQKSVAVDSTNAETFRSIAINYFKLDKNKQAYKYIKKAEKYNNGRFEDLFMLKVGTLYLMENNESKISLLDKEIEECKTDSLENKLFHLKLMSYNQRGNFHKVINLVSEKIKQVQKSKKPTLRNVKGLAYLGLKKYDKALEIFSENKNSGFDYNLHMLLANILIGDSINAKKHYYNLKDSKQELIVNIQTLGLYKSHEELMIEYLKSLPEK